MRSLFTLAGPSSRRKRWYFFFAAFVVLFISSLVAVAQNNSNPAQYFDTSELSKQEKRFLQSALAFEGDYTALVDGAWGRGSQADN